MASNQRRTGTFKWEARMALYEHFQNKYGLSTEEVDSEIERVKENFKLRQHQAIEPKELWQKVGMDLERKLSEKKKKKTIG
jgi:hypothetical protein